MNRVDSSVVHKHMMGMFDTFPDSWRIMRNTLMIWVSDELYEQELAHMTQ